MKGTFADTTVFLKPAPAGTGIIAGGAVRAILELAMIPVPAGAGTGIIAGGAVRAILELAGIKNVYSKVYGSRTPINVIRATHAGIQSMKEYDKVMVLRGLKTAEEIKAMHPAPAVQKPYVKPVAPAQKPAAPKAAMPKTEGGK